ncbi:MAG: polyphenol oxidase family protein [Ktedonobacterales bacterium]
MPVIERHGAHSTYLLFEHLAEIPGLTHAVFTRRGGFSSQPFAGLNASATTGDDLGIVLRNKQEIVDVLGLPLVGARPVHAGTVAHVARPTSVDGDGAWLEPLRSRLRHTDADAMLADQAGFALCWAFGDCAPILLVDPRSNGIALVHAGWRGTAAGIAYRAVQAMTDRYGTRPADILAGIGPSIGACCYAVSREVRESFDANPCARDTALFVERPADEADRNVLPDDSPNLGREEPDFPYPYGHRHVARTILFLDIPESNHRQLLAAGVAPDHIESSGYCTGCRTDLFYSHRREPWPSGRFAVGIGRHV